MNLAGYLRRYRLAIGVLVAIIATTVGISIWLDMPIRSLFTVEFAERALAFVGSIVTIGFIERSLQAATPIALAAIGGLYAEKTGVFNIGLEGFMIFGAVNAVAVAWIVSGSEQPVSETHLWIGIAGAVLISIVYTIVFAVLLIRYKADQIVAGLAVWILGLGFGPFTAVVMWGSQSSPRVGRISTVTVPVLADIPYVGAVLFDTSPLVLLTIALVVLSWGFLYRTRYGYWLQAAGENPEALDTAGISVNRVRYAAVIFSGVMAGLGGAVLAVGLSSGFVGSGQTMVDGRGWIGIVAYLFGNYNPIGAFVAALLFGSSVMFQFQLQTVNIQVSATLMELLPYVVVIVVLTVYGTTRMPSYVGEPYESED